MIAGLVIGAGLVSPQAVRAQTPEDVLLRASNAEVGDQFGRSVDVDGNQAIVGTRGEDGPSNGKSEAGAAYIFERSGDDWNEVQLLRPSNADAGDKFGNAVAIDGDQVIVGALHEDGPSDGQVNAGAAYIFERIDGSWQEVQVLRASNANARDKFGNAVALDNGRAIVGARDEDGPSNSVTEAGAAYVFERSGDGWPQTETAILRGSNADVDDAFGIDVSIDGDRAIVGAWRDDGPSNGKDGAGAAYVFERTAGGWSSTADQILRASNADRGDQFGVSVALSGDRAIVGARREDGGADNTFRAGAAYVFERTASGWPKNEAAILRASNASSRDLFGNSVSIDAQRAIVGTKFGDVPSAGEDTGAAYVFERSGGNWPQTENEILRSSNADTGDRFARDVDIDGKRVIVGAKREDGSSNDTDRTGAAYVFNDLTSPFVAADTARVVEETRINVFANDGPGLGTIDSSSVQVETSPMKGTATANADGTINYVATNAGVGEGDVFTYTVANENGRRSTEATVTIRVLSGGYGAGQAVAFDGTDDLVRLPDDPAINTGGPYETRTIEFWFNAADISGSTEQVLYEEGGPVNGLNVYLKDGMLYVGGWSEGRGWSGAWLSTASVERATWHHVALVFDASDGFMRGYLDGTRFGEKRPGSKLESHPFAIAIGAASQDTKFSGAGDFNGTGRYFDGTVDQLRLWDGALTQTQIRARSTRTIDLAAPVADSLIAAYRFDSGTGTAVFDYADAAGLQDGTFSGDPQWTAFSGGRFGDVSAVLSGGATSVGAEGGAVTVENVAPDDTVQVYRYGRNDGPLIEGTRAGEDFSGVPADRHLHVVWGIDTLSTDLSADVTFDFSGITGVNDPSDVRLLKRERPGTPWTDVTGDWTLDPETRTFSKSGVSSFSQYTIGGTSQTLPVELAAFAAQRTEEGVSVSWRTASEQGNAGFELQRRAGETGWTTIGRREGAGTTSRPQRYRYEDRALPYEADSLAYRLKQIDTDGTVHVSEAVSVGREEAEQLRLQPTYPNPASGRVTVRFAVPAGTDGEPRLALYDVLGRRVRSVPIESAAGRTKRQLDVSGLSSGVYVLQLAAGGETRSRRVTVVR